MASASVDRQSVFLNTPFDARYESLFVTLVASLAALGLKPRCVLEIRETGQGRLGRIYDLLKSCSISIHDLSRVGTPPRFNMPFELGLAAGLRLADAQHEIIVLDAVPHRLDKHLSDYKGRDPLIHRNRCTELGNCMLDVFDAPTDLNPQRLRAIGSYVRKSARAIKSDHKSDTIFRRAAFLLLVAAATQHAVDEGFIAS